MSGIDIYLDTSVVVAACVNEPSSAATIDWLMRQEAGSLGISDWSYTEVAAAFSIKARRGELSSDARAIALSSFARLTSTSLVVLRVEPSHFLSAARFADQYALGLRAGDALHLAVCASYGASVCTFDKRQALAGVALGIRTFSPL
jgi:predicted nucleic acid-binding protein